MRFNFFLFYFIFLRLKPKNLYTIKTNLILSIILSIGGKNNETNINIQPKRKML